MLSIGSVAASENINPDNTDNNDLISLPVYSTSEVEDNGNMQNDVDEVSLETNNKTHSLGDVLGVSNNSPLGADPPNGTFNDIQKAINGTASGKTVFLNGTKYSGNKVITIDRNITIDGADSKGNGVSILDANSTSGIFSSSGKYNITLKNLILENPSLNVNGYCAYFTGGIITIQNVTIRNIKGTGKQYRAIFTGAGSTVNISNLTFKNNTIKIKTNRNVYGILLLVGNSSNVEISNLNIFDNNISAEITNSTKFYGFVYVDRLSNVSMSDVNYCNNYLDVINADIDGGFFYGLNGTFNLSNLNFEDNIVLNYTNMRSFIRVVTNSSIVLTNVHFYRNYVSGYRNVGTILSVIDSRALVNYCYIEDNCVNNTLLEIKPGSKINQAGFISIQGVGTVNQCHSLNNYVNDAFGGILRFESSYNIMS